MAGRRARGLSLSTLQFYATYLTPFVEWVQGSMLEVGPDTILAFMESRECSPGGRHAYFRAIRAFYKWAMEQGHIEKCPTDKLKAPKVPQPLRYAVPLPALATLLAGCETLRDQVIVSLLADTGVRRAELAGLRLKDIKGDMARVWGKGAKQRVVRFGPGTQALVEEWVTQHGGGPEDSLLGLTAWGVGEVLERLEKRTGIKCNAHAFRRTFATEQIRGGMNLFYVQSLLGHEDLTMTRVYAQQVNSEDAIHAYRPVITS